MEMLLTSKRYGQLRWALAESKINLRFAQTHFICGWQAPNAIHRKEIELIPGLNMRPRDVDPDGDQIIELHRHYGRNVVVRVRIIGIARTVGCPGKKEHQTENSAA
jgi:hypothetical protein